MDAGLLAILAFDVAVIVAFVLAVTLLGGEPYP